MCNDGHFIVIYGFIMSYKKYNIFCTLVTNCFCVHSSVILVFISLVALQLAETVRHLSTYIILYLHSVSHVIPMMNKWFAFTLFVFPSE